MAALTEPTLGCLYDIQVFHERLTPIQHKFHNHLYMFYLNLDELPALAQQLPDEFGHNTQQRYGFWDSDHLPFQAGETPRRYLEQFLKENGVHTHPQHIFLLTHLRFQNTVFNPISLYYCFDSQHTPLCAVAEVSNTFHETKPFFIPYYPESQTYEATCPKLFYISPFSRPDTHFYFRLKTPGETLQVLIQENTPDGTRLLNSSMSGTAHAITTSNLRALEAKHPKVTKMVKRLIHWHAFLLFCKGLKFHWKEENQPLQQGMFNPHFPLKFPFFSR